MRAASLAQRAALAPRRVDAEQRCARDARATATPDRPRTRTRETIASRRTYLDETRDGSTRTARDDAREPRETPDSNASRASSAVARRVDARAARGRLGTRDAGRRIRRDARETTSGRETDGCARWDETIGEREVGNDARSARRDAMWRNRRNGRRRRSRTRRRWRR
jgi:hypothetical protein